MAYFAPYIDETGFHYPTYQDIVDDMVNGAKSIFGDDIYLENDSADYQLISIFALKTYDTLQGIAMAYNSRSPVTAVGVGLDGVVKINGIARKPGSRSTADVVITGTPYTQIVNGSVTDANGTVWNLPANVSIPTSGSVTVTATCSEVGPVAASAGELVNINTPTYGWLSVTNPAPAVPGELQETDGELRVRQTASVAGPSQTMLAGTYAAIAAIDNVQRLAVYENDTNSAAVNVETNPYGLPPHSITCVVEGGDTETIADAILRHKGVGCYTNGDISTSITDAGGYANVIRFYRPTAVPIHVTVTLTPYSGYLSTMADEVKQAIYDYLTGFDISADVSVSLLTGVAIAVNPDVKHPNFGVASVRIGRTAGSQAASDISIGYKEVATIELAHISVGV
jgi:uncharacterized phage protein gp47/JayE